MEKMCQEMMQSDATQVQRFNLNQLTIFDVI